MRVALYVHCYFPGHFYGTESYTRTLARELQALGHEPVVVTATFQGEPAQAAFVERDSFDGVPVIRIDRNVHPNGSVRDTYDQPAIAFAHERILRAVKPDIVHVCHLVNHTTALLDVTRALAIPTVATFTDFFGFCFNNKLQADDGGLCAGPSATRDNCVACWIEASAPGGLLGRFDWPGLRRVAARALTASETVASAAGVADTVAALKARPGHLAGAYRTYDGAIAPSRFLADAYRRNGYAGSLELSHFGIDIDRAAKPLRDDGRVRLGFIGQLAPHKGTHLLLEAMRTLSSDALSLSIWGDETQDPSYAGDLRRLADGLPVAFRGTFPTGELAAILAETDVLVIPSTWFENSPLILLQALATHTPVIVADVEGMTEFVETGVNGYSFARGSSADLAARLDGFILSPQLARQLSATTRYERSSRNMVEDVVALYERILTRPAAGRVA